MAATLGVPTQQASALASSSTNNIHIPIQQRSLRATRSATTFRTPHSSDNDLSADGSHLANNTGSSGGLSLSHHALSLSPPPDLSFSRSSLHSDQETEFLSRPGGSGVSFNQPYLDAHHQSQPAPEHEHEHVRIASSSRSHDPSSTYPYHQSDSWGSRISANNTSSKSRIRLDSVFGTQLPGFPYLNSAAAATSSAIHPVNPHYHIHHGSSSSADLLKGRSSYNWSERSASAAGHHPRAPTAQSMRSVHGKESIMSLGRHTPALKQPLNAVASSAAGDLDTSCSGETGESNSSDEVDLDLSFDMDVLRARQMQQHHARQQRGLQQQHQQQPVGISSLQVQAERQARSRALSSTEAIAHHKSGHVGIDMPQASNTNEEALSGLPYHASEEHRRYLLSGKKRLSRSAVELRPARSNRLHASIASMSGAPIASTSREPAAMRYQTNHPYRQSGRSSSTMPALPGGPQNGKSSHNSLDLAVDIPLSHDDTRAPHATFMDEDETSAQVGWSFATTPPLSPAEIVTYAEGVGNPSKGQRRYSAGASNLFQSLDRKKSSTELLQRKRRPSFPLMSLFDKTGRSSLPAGTLPTNAGDTNAAVSPHSPDSDPSWGSPTPRDSVVLDLTATQREPPPPQQHAQQIHKIPLYPMPSCEPRNRGYYNASISDLAGSPENIAGHLPPPPRLHDPASRLDASPISSVGTPGTLSPDMGATNSTFSSPRSPDDTLPTPRTADFSHSHDGDGNRYSQFSMKAVSDGGMSFASAGSETLEAVNFSKGESKVFVAGGESPAGLSPNLEAIPEQNDSPQKSVLQTSTSHSSASSATGGSPKTTRPPSALQNQSGGGGLQPSQVQNEVQQQSQGHKRQSSSLFRFPFVSSLRNPFASRSVSGPSVTAASAHLNDQSSSSSHDSPSGSVEELLSPAAIAAGIAQKSVKAAKAAGKRSDSPNSSEESHFLPPSDPPTPPRPGATSQASKGIDPSMLRQGPNVGKGRLSGLGLSFPSTFVNSLPPRQISEHRPKMHHPSHQPQRQASLPVLSFSAASDEQHENSGRSVESEEAAIQVIPDENGYGRPVEPRNSLAVNRRLVSDNGQQRPFPTSAPATTVHLYQDSTGLDSRMQQIHTSEFGSSPARPDTVLQTQTQAQTQYKRPRTRLLSAQGFDLRGRVDRMRPSQLLFLAAFIAGPWCFLVGGWCLRSIDGDYRSAKGIRCRCPDASEACECQAEIYKQIKLSGGQVERVLQSQNGEVRRMDSFVLANRVAALTCGTGTLVLAITALIVVGRAW